MFDLLKRFVREDEGATMVEYGLMIALIAVVLIATVSLVGKDLKASFANTDEGIKAANAADNAAGAANNAPVLP